MITWEELPIRIQEKMLENQVKQGNPRNPDVFKKEIRAGRFSEGFEWSDCEDVGSYDSHEFWSDILEDGNLNLFYEVYPKKEPNISQKINDLLKIINKT